LKELKIQYKKILSDYISNQTERNLYIGQNFVRQLIQKNIAPEDVINIHKQAMEDLFENLSIETRHSFDFLIEIMIHFGLTLKEHQSLLELQEEMKAEISVATKIQSMLLKTSIPKSDFLDIGMVSIPIRKMNGDYVHFINDEESYISVGVTDVVGKGVPAALCMSMVKYGLDTLEYADTNPAQVLSILNRIIEKSVDDSMFVSMFYGRFDFLQGIFTYGSAGHEPAIHYSAQADAFYDLDSKGLLLGVMPEVRYAQNHVLLEQNDIIIMMTDGVTEFRKESELVPQTIIKEFIRSAKHLPAQEICEKLYQYLLKFQEFDLQDDFTVVIFKKIN
jgi:phosphoserine phosphatase RsbU/P